MSEHAISVTVNGTPYRRRVEARRTLADFLREDCALTGTHLGCEHGVCGACTVLLDGEAVALVPDVRGAGRRSRGRDGRRALAAGRLAQPVQDAFRAEHGLQCGFCTPGFIVTVTALLAREPRLRPTTRSARGSPGTSAAAPATRGSSTPFDERARRGRRRELDDDCRRFVGQTRPRREDPRLVTGHGTYVDDVVVPGMLHAAFVRSDLARGPHHAHRRRGRARAPGGQGRSHGGGAQRGARFVPTDDVPGRSPAVAVRAAARARRR